MKRFLLLLLLAFAAGFFQARLRAEEGRLNVVLILVDDLGWTDLGCFGSDLYQTPHIDALARDGMRFTQAYSACTVCSPTRASILTGKYPARLHITDWIPGRPPVNPRLLVPEWTKYLPLEETCLAEVFKAAGYRTASIGKWHLGDEAFFPEKHGFDVNVAGLNLGSPANGYFVPWKIATLPEGKDGDYLTDRLGQEAVKFIEASKDQPFFLYLPHFGVHTPIQGKPALVEKYKAITRAGKRHQNSHYAAMIESVDDSVGLIRAKLQELGLSSRTMIVFTSDNGGHIPTTSNAPLRVGKGSCYLGGTRVPTLISWPGVTKPGSVCDAPVISMDYYPTVLEAAGVADAVAHQPDGVSLVPLLKQPEAGLPREALFWHYPHYQLYQQGGTTPYSAVISGGWRLVEFLADQKTELYHIAEDISESRDLAATEPAMLAKMRGLLNEWRQEVGAQMPAKNPAYDPAKPEDDPLTRKKKKKAPAEK